MAQRSHESDRRKAPRFEVFGRHGANLMIIERLRVVNMSLGGLLVQTARPLGDEAVYTLQLESTALVSTVQARVVRVRRSADRTYEVALEFVGPDGGALATISQMLQSGASSGG